MPRAAGSYEEEQERLRRTSEGERDEDDPRLAIPKAPEVNPEVYRDVLPMLFRGFLTLPAEINGVFFVFKSLNHHEFEMVRLMGGGMGDHIPPRFWDLFLAHGVFLIDGQNVLVERQRWMPRIANVFRDLLPKAKAKVIRALSELNRRAANATLLTEAYAMETYSRYRWAQLHGLDLSMAAVTGVSGTDTLGLNWAQYTWRALNYFEDMSAATERDWEHAKFVASSMAGKGIQRVYNRDHDRRRKEAEERIARKDKLLRHVIEGAPMEDGTTIRNGQVVIVAQTVEELADQLDKSLRGEKDWHDQVIEAHEQRVKEQNSAQRAQLRTMAQDAAERFGDRSVVGETNLAPLSQAEVQERIQRSRQLQAQALARGVVSPEPEKEERMAKFLERHGLLGPDVETTVAPTDRDPSTATPIPPQREPGKPWRP